MFTAINSSLKPELSRHRLEHTPVSLGHWMLYYSNVWKDYHCMMHTVSHIITILCSFILCSSVHLFDTPPLRFLQRLMFHMTTNFTAKLKHLHLNLHLLLSEQTRATKYSSSKITSETTLESPTLGSGLGNMSVYNPRAVSVQSVRLSAAGGEWPGKMKSADARKPSGNTMGCSAAMDFSEWAIKWCKSLECSLIMHDM